MTVLDFTKKTTPFIDKLIKLGFHYQSTDKIKAEGIRTPSGLIATWENVMNGVILKIVDTYAVRYDENGVTHQTPTEYITITDDCTNISVTMSVEEFMELERITNSKGNTFPCPETSTVSYERIPA